MRSHCSGHRSGDALSNFSKLNKEVSKSSPGRHKHQKTLETVKQTKVYLCKRHVRVKVADSHDVTHFQLTNVNSPFIQLKVIEKRRLLSLIVPEDIQAFS